jgi:hypothetical protein
MTIIMSLVCNNVFLHLIYPSNWITTSKALAGNAVVYPLITKW